MKNSRELDWVSRAGPPVARPALHLLILVLGLGHPSVWARAPSPEHTTNAPVEKAAQVHPLQVGRPAAARKSASLDLAASALQELRLRLDQFRLAHPGLGGSLVQDDLSRLTSQLAAARRSWESGASTLAGEAADAVRQQAEWRRRILENYDTDLGAMEGLSIRLEMLAQASLSPIAKTHADSAREALLLARQEHQAGNADYAAYLGTARTSLAALDQLTLTRTQGGKANAWLAWGGAGLFLVVLSALALKMGGRRRDGLDQVLVLLTRREQELENQTTRFFQLLERCILCAGTSQLDASARYTGETLALAHQLMQRLDEIFLLCAAPRQILEEVQALLPRRALGRWLGASQSALCQSIQKRLGEGSVEFNPNQAERMKVVCQSGRRNTLMGPRSSLAGFRLSWEAMEQRVAVLSQEVAAGMDRLEASLEEIKGVIDSARQNIGQVRSLQHSILEDGREDGLFLVPALFFQLLPDAEDALADALELALPDPIGAVSRHGTRSRQMAQDALALALAVVDWRASAIPKVRDFSGNLSRAGLTSGWFEEELESNSAQAEHLARLARQQPVPERIEELKYSMATLVGLASCAVALERERAHTVANTLHQANAALASMRRQISDQLGLEPEQVLHETHLNPEKKIEQAAEQSLALKAALERGDIAGAQGAMVAITENTNEVMAIVEATSQALRAQEHQVQTLLQVTRQLLDTLPEHQKMVSSLAELHEEAALRLGEGDPLHPRPELTLGQLVEEAEVQLAQTLNSLEQSQIAFGQGRLQESEGHLQAAHESHETARSGLELIRERKERLLQLKSSNLQLCHQLQTQEQEIRPRVQDPRSTGPSLRAFESVSQLLEAVSQELDQPLGNPFRSARELASAARSLAEACAQIQMDAQMFAEAQRSVRAVETLLGPASCSPARAGLAKALKQLQLELTYPHGDWRWLCLEADRLYVESARLTAQGAAATEAIEPALSALSAAAGAVRRVQTWEGRHGVEIDRTCGSCHLACAHGALVEKNYLLCRQEAVAARQEAVAALDQGELQVRRRIRDEHRAEEETRFRRREEELARKRRRHPAPGWHPVAQRMDTRETSLP